MPGSSISGRKAAAGKARQATRTDTATASYDVEAVRAIYRTLARSWGPQHWWPAQTPFEVIVGAILTQNTAWTNVEKAMTKLREAGVLSLEGIRALPVDALEPLVRSSGYFRQKAARLKMFVRFVNEKYAGSLSEMFSAPTDQLREELLSLKGIGRETADSILLYAGNHDIFVVDTYTRRILERHQIVCSKTTYDEIRLLVEEALKKEIPSEPAPDRDTWTKLSWHFPSPVSVAQRSQASQTFNEMHGLLVQVGKHYCHKTTPDCKACPLEPLLPTSAAAILEV